MEASRVLAESLDDLAQLPADPDDERDVQLRVAPRFGFAEPADAVDDAREIVRFEREDPLPVAESRTSSWCSGRTSGNSRPIVPCSRSSCERCALCHQVPVLRPDERVDAEVALRRLAAQERGQVVRVELGRTRHAEERVRQLEARVRARVRRSSMSSSWTSSTDVRRPPEEEVGVRTQTGRRVRAAHAHAVGELVEERGDLVGLRTQERPDPCARASLGTPGSTRRRVRSVFMGPSCLPRNAHERRRCAVHEVAERHERVRVAALSAVA